MNGIFVQLLYESVQLSEVERLTVALGGVYTSYTKLEVLLLLVHQLYDHYTTQACSLGRSEQSAVNDVFVQLLYGSVRLPQIGLYNSSRFCVQELYQTGRSRCSLYTRCMTIRPLKHVQ